MYVGSGRFVYSVQLKRQYFAPLQPTGGTFDWPDGNRRAGDESGFAHFGGGGRVRLRLVANDELDGPAHVLLRLHRQGTAHSPFRCL